MTFNKDDQQLHQYLLLTSNHKTIMTDGDGNPKPDLNIQNPAWTYKKYSRVKTFNVIPYSLDNWISKGNTYIKISITKVIRI